MDLKERVRKDLNKVLSIANDSLQGDSVYNDEVQLKGFGRLLTIKEIWHGVLDNGETIENYPDLKDETKAYILGMLDREETETDDFTFGPAWHKSDILQQAKEEGVELTDEQCKEVADYIEHTHDANIGINWEVISEAILFVTKPKW